MTCNCYNNNTTQDDLRLVRGNDFATLHDIFPKYPDGTSVEDFDLADVTELTILVKRNNGSAKDVSVYCESNSITAPKQIRIDWDGLKMGIGSYRFDFSGKFQGKDWRSYSRNEGFGIVESNEEANIPVGSFIADGVYQIKTDFLMTYQTQEQSDWEETDTSSPSYIKNKPTIPTSLSDLTEDSEHRTVTNQEKETWNNKSDFSGNYEDLTHKPTIPAEQVQSDWEQTNTSAKDYIKNKPDISALDSVPTRAVLNTTLKQIEFYHGEDSTPLYYMDATPLMKDGMLTGVTYAKGNLTFTFNEDAGLQPITYFIGDAFDNSDYTETIAQVNASINTLRGQMTSKVDVVPGKGLSTEDYTTSEKNKLAGLENYDDSALRSLIAAKADTTALASLVDGGGYNSTSKKIELKHGNTVLAEIDATAFIKDGMVSSVTIDNGYLVITFNTDAGQSPIRLDITSIFNAANYYTKTQTDNLLGGKQDTINDISAIRSGAALGATAVQTESDPTVPAWAKQPTKPSYTASEVGALPSTTSIPSTLAELGDDTNHRTVSDAEKETWNNKQSALTFDSTPASGSANPVTSGGVYSAISGKVSSSDVTTIEKKTQAQFDALATKDEHTLYIIT